MKLSVVIPVYNSEKILNTLINSIKKNIKIKRKIIKPSNEELQLHQKYLKSDLQKNYYK